MERTGPWPARVAWILLAAAAAGCVGDALDHRSSAVRLVVLVGLWLGWTVGLVALLVPRSSALTVLRIVVPAGCAAMVACTVAGDAVDGSDVLAVGLGAVAAAAVLTPWVGEAWVDGSSYGPERRFLLRPPVLFSAVVVPVTWLVVVLGASVGPLLLAAEQWALGGLLSVVGIGAVWGGSRSLHQLARRWVVLVPTGLVIHDHLTMPEAQLVPRTGVARFGPAPADPGAPDDEPGDERRDLSAGAPGLALQLELTEAIELLVRTHGRDVATVPARRIVLTASRPGHLLEAAEAHRIPVG